MESQNQMYETIFNTRILRHAHAIKGMSANFAAEQVMNISSILEKEVKNDRMNEACQIFAHLKEASDQVLAVLFKETDVLGNFMVERPK